MSNNQLLLQFLLAYMNWLYTGAQSIQFKRNTGLCSNLRRYYDFQKEGVVVHMCDLFEKEGLNRAYPFNDYACDFVTESDNSSMHLNPHRNIWVYAQIERLKHEDSLPRHTQVNERV